MLDRRQQFKVGFLLKAAQLGMSLEEVENLVDRELTKEAGIADWIPGYDILQHAGKKTIDVGAGLAKNLGQVGLTAAVMAPVGIGAAVGHGLAKTRGLGNDETPEEEKQRELIDAYRQAAEKARLNRSASTKRDKARSQSSYGII